MKSRSKPTVPWVALAASLLGIVFAASCSQDEVEPTSTIDYVVEGATATPPADPSVKSGGTLLFPVGECDNPDPAFIDRFADFNIANELHAGLTRIAPIDGWSVVPELAASWEPNAQHDSFAFTLRPDLVFADGSPITASDVKWSWERVLNLQGIFLYASSIFDIVDGHDAFVAGDAPEVTGLEVVDDLTVRVTLTEPTPHFPMVIADHVAAVVSQHSKAGWSMGSDSAAPELGPWRDNANQTWPVGAGPFSPGTYDSANGGCTIVRNPNYWGPPAFLDSVNLVPFNTEPADGESHWYGWGRFNEAFNTNEIDYLDLNADVFELPKSMVANLPAGPTNIEYLTFNTALPPFDNIHFRRALMQASPVVPLTNETARWILPPWLRNSPMPRTKATSTQSSPRDTLEQCQCEELYEDQTFALTYHFPDLNFFDDSEIALESIVFNPHLDELFDKWRRATGINVETGIMVTTDADIYNDHPVLPAEVRPQYPDPASFIERILPDDLGNYDVVELRELADKARATAGPDQRAELYLQLEREILDRAIAFPILTGLPPRHRLKPWVRNFVNQPFGGSTFHGIWLDDPPLR